MLNYKKQALGLIAAVTCAGSWAAPQTFSSETLSPGSVVSSAALAARFDLLSNLAGTIQTFGFESSLIGVGDGAPLAVDFVGSSSSLIRATLNGSGTVATSNGGRFDTTSSGSGRLWQTRAGGPGGSVGDSFTIDFSKGIAAFGFYATDVGDFDGAIKLLLTPSDGTADVELDLKNSTGTVANGNLLFFGFYDRAATYSKITFTSSGKTSSTDYFGFDDFLVADPGQLVTTVPEPTSVALVGLALIAGGLATRRRPASQG
jgi:PEP-CTERM motif